MGFFGDIISDARLPVAPVRTDAGFNQPAVSVDMTEVSPSPTGSLPEAFNPPEADAPVFLNASLQNQSQDSVEPSVESSTEPEVSFPGPEARRPASQPLIVHADDAVLGNKPEIASPVSQPDLASTAPEQSQADDAGGDALSQQGARHPVMAEPGVQTQESGASDGFENFTRLADTFYPNRPTAEAPMQTSAKMPTESTYAMTEHTQLIQTPDSGMRIRSRTEHIAPEHITPEHTAPEHTAPEHTAPETGHADPVIATVQQADQWLGGGRRMYKPVAGARVKKEESRQQSGVKIGRIDVLIEAPVQQTSTHVEQQQVSSHGFSSRHYLRGV